jgi:hypothetical protein
LSFEDCSHGAQCRYQDQAVGELRNATTAFATVLCERLTVIANYQHLHSGIGFMTGCQAIVQVMMSPEAMEM